MSSPILDQQLGRLRRRLRQVILTVGLAWCMLIILGAVLAECVGDWWLHFDDPILRLILGLGIAASAVWCVRQRLVVPLRRPLSDVALAQSIEAQFPGFQDGLASSVQFVSSGSDPRLGSPQLQRAVVVAAERRLAGLDCTRVVSTRTASRTATAALGVCCVALLLAGLQYQAAGIALTRLVLPFSGTAWPRQTNLQFLREDLKPYPFEEGLVQHLARGDTLPLVVANASGRLPPRVELEIRHIDGKVHRELLRPTTIKQDSGRHLEVAVGQLLAGKETVEFRVVGGDDDQMPWHRLEIVTPPSLDQLQLTLIPPAYSRRPIEQLPAGVGHVEGLVGSRVEIAAHTRETIRRAALRVGDGPEQELELANEGTRLAAAFLLEKPGLQTWWFELMDAGGFQTADPPRYELKGIEDTVPEIVIELPAADSQATADAIIRLRTTARDDLGLTEIRLVYRIAGAGTESEEQVSLARYSRPLSSDVQAAGNPPPVQQTLEYEWSLAELRLAPGTQVVFHTEATDEFDLTAEWPDGTAPPPHVGRSAQRTLTIATAADKLREVAQRQEGLLSDLERVHKQQELARQQMSDLATQLGTAGTIRPEDLDTLQRTEIGQREITAQLTSPTSGLEHRAAELLDELHANHLEDPHTERRLQHIAAELARLGTNHLGPIDHGLTQSRKLLQSKARENRSSNQTDAEAAAPDGERPAVLLEQVAQNQAAVAESLGEMLQDLSQWRGEQEAAAELSELTRQQQDLNQRAGELSKTTLTRSTTELTPQERADLNKLAERQKKQAEQLEHLEKRMQSTHQALSSEDPTAAAVLQDAARQSQQQTVAGQMREAAEQIGTNQMGQAGRNQQEVLRKLRDLEDLLQHRDNDSEMLIKKLKATEQELAELRDRQADLLEKLEAHGTTAQSARPDETLARLRQEQSDLKDETARLTRRLSRLEAHQARASASRAASRMEAAAAELESSRPETATAQQQEALDDLEQAQRELANHRREEEETLAREQLARMADDLAALVPRQQAACEETKRLDDLHRDSGKWSRGQLLSLRELAGVQRNLRELADGLAQRLESAPVFGLALRGVVRSMDAAARKLDERETGPETQSIQQVVLRRLIDLVAACRPDEPTEQSRPPEDSQAGGSGQGDAGPDVDGLPSQSQLKLLIALQQELMQRTGELERLRDAQGHLPESARAELTALAEEQGNLADLFLSTAASVSPEGHDKNDADPAVREALE